MLAPQSIVLLNLTAPLCTRRATQTRHRLGVEPTMEALSAPGLSKDAQRHVGDVRHHTERAKDERLDRKDGTGRGHETEKKGGAGKGNWGSLEDTIEVAIEDEADTGPDAVSPRDFVENEKVKTLDEYEAEKAQKA
ncbi:hypothetical protein ABPG75_006858 [Micractinium tetrahymenae]